MKTATAVAKKKKIDPTFGQKLRALREGKGWTQAKLGEAAEMMYQEVARIERGEREPGWAIVVKLAKALGVKPNAFLSDDEK